MSTGPGSCMVQQTLSRGPLQIALLGRRMLLAVTLDMGEVACSF